MRTPFTGVGTALVTPFTKDGSLDEAAVRRLARRQIDAGVHFLSPCGTTGEAPTLTHREKLRVVELVVDEAAGRVPVLAGAGGYDTREVIELARELERRRRRRPAVGDAVLQQADAGRPVPALQGDRREHAAADRALQRARAHRRQHRGADRGAALGRLPNIVGVKEASGNVVQMCEIVASTPDDFLLLSGDDPLTVAVMAIGGRGVISVASNEVPAEMAQIVELCEKGDFAGARKLHNWLLPLIQVNFVEANPIPVQGGDGGDGAARGELPPAAGAAEPRAGRIGRLQELKMLGAASLDQRRRCQAAAWRALRALSDRRSRASMTSA